jgi:ParB family chromosome partitioning protein
MDKKHERRGLGRGLSALMADVNLSGAPDGAPGGDRRADTTVPIDLLFPNPNQPRRDFPEAALADLAASIRQRGVIQPLIVRPRREGAGYEIVAGERRWRAAQIAQVHDLPVIVRDLTDTEVLEVAIIENIQRADLNPVEEALAYRQLMDRFGHTQERLAEALSKSRSHIANLLRLLNLPEEVQAHLRSGALTAGHARALVTTPDPAGLARRVIAGGLSVRETERLAQAAIVPAARRAAARRAEKDADTRALEADLSANLQMPVTIAHDPGNGGGTISVRYRTLDDLDLLCRALSLVPTDLER